MAEVESPRPPVTEFPAPSPLQPPPAARSTSKRPPKREAKAPDAGSSTKLGPIDKNVPLDKLLAYWKQEDQAHPERLLAYLYRHFPVIIRPDREHYIKIYEGPVTREQLLSTWGAGKYELKLTDKDTRHGAVTTCRFEFNEPWAEHPPTINPDELSLVVKANEDYINWRKSRGFPMSSIPQQQAADPNAAVMADTLRTLLQEVLRARKEGGNADQSFGRLMEMFTTANKTALDMALSQVKANSPVEMVELMTKLQALTHPNGNGDSAGNLRLFELMFKMQAEAQARFDTLLGKVFEQRQQQQSSGLSQVKELAETMAVLREAFSGESGGASRSGGKWGWVTDLADRFAPGINDLAQGVGWYLRTRTQRPAVVNVPGAPPPPDMPGGLPPGLPPNPAGVDPNAPPQQAGPGGPANPADEQFLMDTLINTFQQIFPSMMTFLRRGQSGEDFADYLVEGGMLDALSHARIKEIGKDRILGMLKQEPVAWNILGPIEGQFTTFLDQFLAWDPNAAPEEEVPPPAGR